MLRSIIQRAHNLYIGPKPQVKKNGGVRYVFDTKPPLKPLLKKINSIFFRRTHFPPYLTGSIAGRDFIANVEVHKGARVVITEDIAQFFDCITEQHVYRIWREFFRFSDEIADLLTHLMTKDGRVFQGTPTSSYLANLAFWDFEPQLVNRLAARGIRYSRYVDDISISTTNDLSDSEKRWVVAQIYAMIGRGGFKPQRSKHQYLSSARPITIMGLNANSSRAPTITRRERSRIRALIFQLEQRFASGETGPEFRQSLSHAIGKVGRLKRLHKVEGAALRTRLDTIQAALDALPVKTKASAKFESPPADAIDDHPF
ncbi:MAG: reverse transcriptase family protein [Burkholderiales bacterium]|nr:reverse transcriptase family protein [Burkholderiales bacterium]